MGNSLFGFGIPELLIVTVIMIMIFGVGKLPELGSSFGRAISNFKKAVADKEGYELDLKNKT